VKTLECFLQMVPILDKVNDRTIKGEAGVGLMCSISVPLQSVLTIKLVPLLAKIKTKGEDNDQ
jgi:hypothetical protein